jgi:sulfur-oxidizing protein SoxX
VKTYADLVTSIINPSHKLSRGFDNNTVTTEGESQMRSYNEYMTVEELTDIVTFLESKYEIWVPTYYNY